MSSHATSIRNHRQLLLQSRRSHFRPPFNTAYPCLASRYVVTSAVAPTLPKSNPTADFSTASLTLPITSLYSSQSYNHSRAVGPIRLDVVPGMVVQHCTVGPVRRRSLGLAFTRPRGALFKITVSPVRPFSGITASFSAVAGPPKEFPNESLSRRRGHYHIGTLHRTTTSPHTYCPLLLHTALLWNLPDILNR